MHSKDFLKIGKFCVGLIQNLLQYSQIIAKIIIVLNMAYL